MRRETETSDFGEGGGAAARSGLAVSGKEYLKPSFFLYCSCDNFRCTESHW
jgi:hypothetical protein